MSALDWLELIKDINLKKIIEEKVINNSHAVQTICPPITVVIDTDDTRCNFIKANNAQASECE
jgi:hypothetical protein